MASLSVFARRIKKLAERIEVNVSRTVIKTAIAINQAVVISTPVDTGHARVNWQLGISTPVRSINPATDPSGAATIALNNAKAMTRKDGQDIYISNNIDYIGFLNEGSSAQAPAGFVEIAVLAGEAAVKRAKVVK